MTDATARPRPAPPAAPSRRWCRLGAVLAVCALAVPAVSTQAPGDAAHAQALARRASARIIALQREADALASRERTLLNDLRRLEVERDLRTEQYEQGERDLGRIQEELRTTSSRIGQLEVLARAQAPALAARVVELYKLGKAGYARLLLNVDDLREVRRAYRFVSALQQLDGQRVAEHGRTLAELRGARAVLEQRRQQRLAIQEQVGVSKTAAAKAAAAQSALVEQIDRRRDLAAQLVGELQAARQKLQQRLAALAQGGPGAATAVPTLPLAPFRGDLDWPLDGRVLAPFGRQRDPQFNTAIISNGVRIAAAPGAPVRVIHEGAVVFAEPFSGFGNLVVVDHGGQAFTMYGTLATMAVSPGAHVITGQEVGTAGASPDGVASIYFELRVDGKPVDPLQWLKKK